MGRFIFPKSMKWRTFSVKHVKKEDVNFIFKFIPSSYIKNLLDTCIVVKLKIKKKKTKNKKRWPKYRHITLIATKGWGRGESGL